MPSWFYPTLVYPSLLLFSNEGGRKPLQKKTNVDGIFARMEIFNMFYFSNSTYSNKQTFSNQHSWAYCNFPEDLRVSHRRDHNQHEPAPTPCWHSLFLELGMAISLHPFHTPHTLLLLLGEWPCLTVCLLLDSLNPNEWHFFPFWCNPSASRSFLFLLSDIFTFLSWPLSPTSPTTGL